LIAIIVELKSLLKKYFFHNYICFFRSRTRNLRFTSQYLSAVPTGD
jgi:hypothetical protein